jgi:hypothetical protein
LQGNDVRIYLCLHCITVNNDNKNNMDDIKLYASKKNHILSLLTITENFSNDIGMSFGIDKCKTQSICRDHYENLEYTYN